MRILLIEDERDMARLIASLVSHADFIVDKASTLADALAALRVHAYDSLLLDRRLPDGDGISLLSRARAMRPGIRVMMITALDALGDKISGLEAGADVSSHQALSRRGADRPHSRLHASSRRKRAAADRRRRRRLRSRKQRGYGGRRAGRAQSTRDDAAALLDAAREPSCRARDFYSGNLWPRRGGSGECAGHGRFAAAPPARHAGRADRDLHGERAGISATEQAH